MNDWVLDLPNTGDTPPALIGGKAARLGALSKIPGIQIPPACCVTTAAYRYAVEPNQALRAGLDHLTMLHAEDQNSVRAVSAKMRQTIVAIALPRELVTAMGSFLSEWGDLDAYAVRSSATAEDLPHTSHAGLQDTYLNIVGLPAILDHIRLCWASLFTDRAVLYRKQHGFDERQVAMAVIVQRMVFSEVSGVVFTADPQTANRQVVSIDASFGLGDAVVGGLVSPDHYTVLKEHIVDKHIAAKRVASYAHPDGGTGIQPIEREQQGLPVLTDSQILHLARIGREIAASLGEPQDIEWGLVDKAFYILQSRPITTLYPIPEASDDETHVYLSVGHQQMMTAAMKPLGLSFFLLTTPAMMRPAGGRLFVDCTPLLASAPSREVLLQSMAAHDPLMFDALSSLVEREGFIESLPTPKTPDSGRRPLAPPQPIVDDPTLVADIMRHFETSLDAFKERLETQSGPDVLESIRKDIQELKNFLIDPQSRAVLQRAMDAATWINDHMKQWLGEHKVARLLSLSVPNNVTAEMGLALLEVADAIRPYPAVVQYLQQVKQDNDNFLDELALVDGGGQARFAIHTYLRQYGMRCPGEIDITTPRWAEKPGTLVPLILNHIREFAPNAGARKFEQGLQQAAAKERELLERLRQLPDGQIKAQETQQTIRTLRHLTGYREYPKYAMMKRYFTYKQALLKEADQLVRSRVILDQDDIGYLTFDELADVLRSHKLDYQVIRQRKNDYKAYTQLTPPRAITSDGEIIVGHYHRGEIPDHALVGLAVSSGVVEGRARIISNLGDANLEDGDILVTTFTDPGWTPLFVVIAGLVTEVGGLMTHGAVIAREYGLPAVVGVERATQRIKDGQRIRVHGTAGYVEIL